MIRKIYFKSLLNIGISAILSLGSIGSFYAQLFTPGAGVSDVDGNNYQTIIIDGKEYMSENLRTSVYANGDAIPNVNLASEWSNLTTGAWEHYANDITYENPYGKLYNWFTVEDPRNVCPTGWHVPSFDEFGLVWDEPIAQTSLIYYLGGQSVAGGKMKINGTQYWEAPNEATNESGFSFLPGGGIGGGGANPFSTENMGVFGRCWSSTTVSWSPDSAWNLHFFPGSTSALTGGNNKKWGFSIRCMKNSSSAAIDENSLLNVAIYPNPANDIIVVTAPIGSSITVLNINGQVIKKQLTEGSETTLNVSDLSAGVYLVQVQTAEGIATQKVIKK